MPRSDVSSTKRATRSSRMPTRPREDIASRRRLGMSPGRRMGGTLLSGGHEQAPTAGMRRRMVLPRGIRLALRRGASEGVVVTIGTSALGRVDEPDERAVGSGLEAAVGVGGRDMVMSEGLGPRRLPLAVAGRDG